MNISAGIYKCDCCGAVVHVRPEGNNVYRIGDGTAVPVRTDARWCQHCDRPEWFEQLATPEQLEAKARTLEQIKRQRDTKLATRGILLRLFSRQAAVSDDEFAVDTEIADLVDYSAICKARTDRGRCLDCGSGQSQDIRVDSDGTLQHPGCTGTFQAKNSELAPRISRAARVFSPTGLQIGTAHSVDAESRRLIDFAPAR